MDTLIGVLDIRLIRDNPELLRASQRARGESEDVVDQLLAADEKRRSALAEYERLRAEQKALGKDIPQAHGDEKQVLLSKAKELAAAVKSAEAAAADTQQRLDELARIPSNIVEEGVPEGGEDNYVVLREVGERPELEKVRDHLELGQLLGAIDVARGAKVSGSRFYFLTGAGGRLGLAILNMAMAKAVGNGFTHVFTSATIVLCGHA